MIFLYTAWPRRQGAPTVGKPTPPGAGTALNVPPQPMHALPPLP